MTILLSSSYFLNKSTEITLNGISAKMKYTYSMIQEDKSGYGLAQNKKGDSLYIVADTYKEISKQILSYVPKWSRP